MVSPVLQQGANSVEAYFPAGNWFDLFNYSTLVTVDSGKNVTLDAPPDHINVHVREGNILALQGEALTTQAARNTTFELLVVISSNESTGEVFLDDGRRGSRNGRRGRQVEFREILLYTSAKVENGEFALSQGWFIAKVTVIGLEKVNGAEGLNITKGAELKGKTDVKANFHSDKRFVMVESKVSLVIGKEFELELKPKQVTGEK